MTRSLLVYDASVAPFRAVADRLASRSEGFVPVAWGSEPVQAFLEAQFGERPFSLVLVEGSSVHVGESAVDRLLEGWDVDPTVATLVTRFYPPVAGPFGRVFHGREPADLHGTFPLSEAARPYVDRLRRSHEIPVEPA